MKVNKDYLRETLTMIFGSCPLTDEYIDEVDIHTYSGLDTIIECQCYMRDELKIPYSEDYVAMMKEQEIDVYRKVNLDFNSESRE